MLSLAKTHSLIGCSIFVRNAVCANRLCYPTKFEVLNSMTQSKFLYEVIMSEYEFHSKGHFYSKVIEGLEMSLKALRVQWKVILYQTWHSEANRAIRILIRSRLPRMLIKVHRWPKFKAKKVNWFELAPKASKLEPTMLSENLTISELIELSKFHSKTIFLEFLPSQLLKLRELQNMKTGIKFKWTTKQLSYQCQQVINDFCHYRKV